MKVLRIFYSENKYTGIVENKKDGRMEAHFKNLARMEDFPADKNPSEAINEIKNRRHFLPLIEDRRTATEKLKDYPDAFSWKLVEPEEIPDRYRPTVEKFFEESLLPPVVLADCKSVKPGSKK